MIRFHRAIFLLILFYEIRENISVNISPNITNGADEIKEIVSDALEIKRITSENALNHQVAVRNVDVELNQIRNDVLNEHNELRSQHGVNPLKISTRLNEAAQQLAQNFATTDAYSKSGMEHIGENAYSDRNDNFSIKKAVQTWYDQERWYNYHYPEESRYRNIEQFAQVVWKDSTDLGIGFVSKNGLLRYNYLICLYKPEGNVKGKYAENVLPPPNIFVQM